MANENANISDKPVETPKRSKLERIAVWSFILLMAIIAGLEYLAMTSYKKTVDALHAAMDEAEAPLTMEDFETKCKSGLAIKTTGKNSSDITTTLFIWPAISQRYKLHLTTGAGDNQPLTTYAEGQNPAAIIGTPKANNDDADDLLGGEAGGGPGGGPGDPMGDGTPGDPMGTDTPAPKDPMGTDTPAPKDPMGTDTPAPKDPME